MLKPLLLSLAAAAALAGPAPALEALSPLPASRWQARPGDGATLELSEKDGCLKLSFAVAPKEPGLSGSRPFVVGGGDVLLAEPRPLPADCERVLWEFLDLTPAGPCEVRLRPLVRDADGEVFVFEPHACPALAAAPGCWQRLATASFYAGEAGGPSSDIYYVGANPANYRPDGALTFLGFRLTVRQYEPGPGEPPLVKGVAALGDVALCGAALPPAPPFAYVDAFLGGRPAGEYAFAARVRGAFQGPVVGESRAAVRYDPADWAARRQRFAPVQGGDGHYWLDYQIRDAAGAVVRQAATRLQIVGAPDAPRPAPVDESAAPAFGCLRVNPGHPGRGVYRRGEPLKVELRAFPPAGKELELRWELQSYYYQEPLAAGTARAAQAGSVWIAPAAPEGQDAFRLAVRAFAGGEEVDAQEYFLGYQSDTQREHPRAGEIADRNKVKERPYNRTTYFLPEPGSAEIKDAPKTLAQMRAHLRRFLENSRALASSFTHMVDLKDFEVLPGVYDFTLLDAVMDLAADYGCRVTVRFAHADLNGTNLYRWPEYSRQQNHDGSVAPGHPYYGAYAVTDPRMARLWHAAYRAVFDRYRRHAAFEGYYVMQPGGEWCVVDQPWVGDLAGYDAVTVRAFQEWLQGQGSLAELNRRWGSAYADFKEIPAPRPTFRDGARPDLRPQWIDFCRFKSVLGSDIWFPSAIGEIRKYDDRRVTIAYGTPRSQAKRLGGLLDYCHNGGNHYGNDLGEYVEAWEKGRIGWITEPHHPHRWAAYGDPGKKGWVLDWSVWVMTAQAAGGGANLHVYYWPLPDMGLTAHYGGHYAYDAFERFKPVLNELHGMRLVAPRKEVAIAQDPHTLFAKHRTTFASRLDDLGRWLELPAADGVPAARLDLDGAVPEPGRYRLLLPNLIDEVISEKTLELYAKMVEGGAKIVIAANTGKYLPGRPEEPFALLRRLGVRPPEKPYDGKGAALRATATAAAAPLFAPGQAIAFQTADSFHAQLQDKTVRDNFWLYPYRWIPETDYFGHYPGHPASDGEVLARFADGGAALSRHRHGQGEALVFWGTPDMSGDKMRGFMARAAAWAGVNNAGPAAPATNDGAGAAAPLRYVLEGENRELGRHYLLVYNEKPGEYLVPAAATPDGDWFLDDPVSAQRLGRRSGASLRARGVKLRWEAGYSPLKFVRMIPASAAGDEWRDAYGEAR